MIIVGLAGASGSGKTTLAEALIGIFTKSGLRVSSIKHAHHDLAFDQPGKDSYRHAQAGAAEVILAARGGFALFSSQAADPAELIARLAPVDLVIVEGFKDYSFPKLEVYRPALGKPPLYPHIPMLAVASDLALKNCPVPVLDLNDPAAIADFLAAALALESYARTRLKES